MLKQMILICCLFIGCKSNPTSVNLDSPIVKIQIVNHTGNNYIKDNVTIIEIEELSIISNEFRTLQEIKEFNIKSSYGFYDIILFDKNGNKREYELVHTKFDGVIIYNYNTNKGYKNDKLDSIILGALQK